MFTIGKKNKKLTFERVFKLLRQFHLKTKIREIWSPYQVSEGPVFQKRQYADYTSYVRHQRFKFDVQRPSKNTKYHAKYRDVLRERLKGHGIDFSGKKVLCLAARTGAEVLSFMDLGAFAVGIDLNPGKQNRYVLTGDFHDIQFADTSADVIFTNAMDHSLDPEKLVSEIRRVLAPGGLFILEAVDGRDKRPDVGFYESFWWQSVDDLVTLFEKAGFKLKHRSSMDFPYGGEHLLFFRS